MSSTTDKRRNVARNAKFLLAAGAAMLTMAASQRVQAQDYQAFVTSNAPLLSGPSPDYPPVADLSGGQPVTVYGCLDGYSWCDVSFQDYRGWFDASLLAYPYQGQRVPLFQFGYQIGLPVIGFSFDDYWGRYYRDRPFFRERERFVHIPLPAIRPHDDRGFGGRPGFVPGRGPGLDRGPDGQPHPNAQRPAPQPHGPEGQRPQPQRAPQAPRPQQAQPHPQGAPAPHPQAAPHPAPAQHPAEKPHPEEQPK